MEPHPNETSNNTPSPHERRKHPRHPVDARATLYLVEIGARLPGRILNISLGGCLIHTDNLFPTGIFRRIEVEFTLNGMPFRLGGVTQGIYGRRRVGIRFLDLSERKLMRLEELISEITNPPDTDPSMEIPS